MGLESSGSSAPEAATQDQSPCAQKGRFAPAQLPQCSRGRSCRRCQMMMADTSVSASVLKCCSSSSASNTSSRPHLRLSAYCLLCARCRTSDVLLVPLGLQRATSLGLYNPFVSVVLFISAKTWSTTVSLSKNERSSLLLMRPSKKRSSRLGSSPAKSFRRVDLACTQTPKNKRSLRATTARKLQTKGNMPTQKPPACTRLAGTPLLFKVRVPKASTKNPGLTPLTPPHGRSNLKVEPQTKTTATWRAQSERKTG